jgi:hypothetical protein
MMEDFLENDLLTKFKDIIPTPVDPGPKLYYASQTDQPEASDVLTKLHMDMTDAINLQIVG